MERRDRKKRATRWRKTCRKWKHWRRRLRGRRKRKDNKMKKETGKKEVPDAKPKKRTKQKKMGSGKKCWANNFCWMKLIKKTPWHGKVKERLIKWNEDGIRINKNIVKDVETWERRRWAWKQTQNRREGQETNTKREKEDVKAESARETGEGREKTAGGPGKGEKRDREEIWSSDNTSEEEWMEELEEEAESVTKWDLIVEGSESEWSQYSVRKGFKFLDEWSCVSQSLWFLYKTTLYGFPRVESQWKNWLIEASVLHTLMRAKERRQELATSFSRETANHAMKSMRVIE